MKPANLESLYRLAPVQEGMLFHTLEAADEGVYVIQLACRLHGRLDAAGLRAAWAALVARHGVLRTSFHWEGLEHPIQAVHRTVSPPWRTMDWRVAGADEREQRLDALRDEERCRGFALDRAPLLRLVLVRWGEEEHVLLATFHHLLLDGWCLPLVFGELLALYRAELSGVPAALTPLRPYREFVAWCEREGSRGAEAHWRNHLAGFGRPTPLPGAPSAGRRLDPATRQISVPWPAAAGRRLTPLAREHRLTLNTVVQGAWCLLLSLETGAADVAFGVTTSGRSADLPGIDRMIGLFINTLPLRVVVDGHAPVVDWLHRVQEAQGHLLEHEHTPLPEVRRWSEVPGDLPLFETILVFENYPLQEAVGSAVTEAPPAGPARLEVEVLPGVDRINYPLALVAYAGGEDGAPPRLEIKADAGRLPGGVPERLATRLSAVLGALVGALAEPGRRVGEVEVLDGTERRQVLELWSGVIEGADCAPGPGGALHDRVLDTARHAPDRVALAWDGGSWSYRALADRVHDLAARLEQLGVGPERVVGVLVERSPEQVVAVLAVLAAGGAFLPLDPADPPERLSFLVADAGLDLILAVPGQATSAGLGSGCTVLELGLEGAGAPGGTKGPATQAARTTSRKTDRDASRADHLAYVLYTSGSTGRPKGVEISRRAILHHLDWVRMAHPLAPGDTAVLKTPLVFDVGVRELVWPLAEGARLVLARSGAHADPAHLVRLLERERPAVLNLVPSILGLLLSEVGAENGGGVGEALDRVLAGGEVLPPALVRRFRHVLGQGTGGPVLYNQYGPTEAAVTTTVHRCQADDGVDGGSVPIGRPIRGARAYVLSRDARPVPPGAPGELVIGGGGLARGYRRRPALTAERFVPHDFASVPGLRLYRSGDLVRHRVEGPEAERGELLFAGRLDGQVQVRGVRVELGEVESVLGAHEQVAACAVVAARAPGPDGPAGSCDRLVAWVVPDAGTAGGTLAGRLREHARGSLPAAAIPSLFVPVDALPRTSTGKVDRRALAGRPVPGPARRLERPSRVAGLGGVDLLADLLAELWRQVLGLERPVEPEESFFDLGGHSLTAVRLVSRIRSRLGVELPLTTLLDRPTPGAVAAWLEASQGDTDPDSPRPEPLPSRSAPLPLSFGQERLWFLDRLAPGSPAYHMAFGLELEGILDPHALRRSR